MAPLYKNGNVYSPCPDCDGALATFIPRAEGAHFGTIIRNLQHEYQGRPYQRFLYLFLRCGGCGRGAVAVVHDNGTPEQGVLESFFPSAIEKARLPNGVPTGVVKEFREGEECASISAYRAGSALMRSVLEKVLKDNGYLKGSLADRIDEAAKDGVITHARQQSAHDDIRVLGNDILHDEWKPVSPDEFEAAHHYAQRIIEDFYDNRKQVLSVLVSVGRLKSSAVATP